MLLATLRLKLRYVLWPYVRLWLLLHGGLAAVAALLVWQWPLVDIDIGSRIEFALPIALVADIWGMQGTLARVEKPAGKRQGNGELLFSLLTFSTLLGAAGTLPYYVIARLGRVQALPTLAALPQYPPARYYQARTVLVDTAQRVNSPNTDVGGGKSRHRYFQLAILCPVVRQLPAPIPAAVPVWEGFYYRADTASASYEIADFWPGYQHFIAQRQALFRRDSSRPCSYFERTDGTDLAMQTLQEALPITAKSAVIVKPVYHSFEERGSTSAFFWRWSQLLGNSLVFLASLLLSLKVGRE